ncbi:MAG: filamentous hemagglutinin N-terminal domain-containing protein [Cyanobacteria bacterium P01_F01_bin.86]
MQPIKAQVIPDATLSGESSITISNTIDGLQGETVLGGAKRGSNLFHSFERFNIPSGQSVYFGEPEGVTRIFSRVTGNSPSEIQGTLGVLGSSDLFFINSNGILFGPEAQLQVGGSFIASTANTIQFPDGFVFSSIDEDLTSPLTITVPIGLGLQNASPITVQNIGREVVGSIFTDELSQQTGLAVLPNQTIALIGGDINLEGGILRTPGGDVEIGSVKDGIVNPSTSPSGINFDYGKVTSFGALTLAQLSLIETSGAPAGRVRFTGSDISLQDGSLAFVRNFGEGVPGNIEVSASESFEIGPSDLSELLLSGLYSDNFGARGPDVLVTAPNISILNGGRIFTNNYNAGLSGNIVINARNSLQVDGFNALSERLVSFVTSNGIGSADSGNLTLNAREVRVLNGAQVGTIAADGAPRAVDVSADTIVVEGSLPISLKPSILGITTAGTGDSDQLSIEANTIQVLNGGAIGTTSIGDGDAGDTVITAKESVEVSGAFPGAVNPSSIDSSVTAINPITRVFLSVRPSMGLDGRAGSISIETPQLFVQNGGAIRVQNDGPGDAGNLNVDAESIQIRSGGQVVATTSGGDGGSINISSDSLLLADQSAISATAVEEGRGGNVTVNSAAIALIGNSRISANAELGSGGQVMITSGTLLQSPESIISATSDAGPALDGQVQLRVSDEAPRTESEIASPILQTPAIATTCTPGSRLSEFTITGRGGLPAAPSDLQQTISGWNPTATATASTSSPQAFSEQIIEAQGWLFDSDGTVHLIAQAPTFVTASRKQATCVGGGSA